MEQIIIKIVGSSALMLHSDRLANPLLPETKAHKELTAKRKKTDADHLAIAHSEYVASLYWTKGQKPFIPGTNFDASFLAGAKLQKLGVSWKRGALVLEDRVPLVYEGPKDPEELWESAQHVDCRGVKVGAAKLMRYRPIFQQWTAQLTVAINTEVLNLKEAKKAIEDAGSLVGVCEYRPRFGRFGVTYG